MLNFLYKAIHHGSCCTVETHIALLLSSGKLRYISSTSTSNQHSFTVSYLINSCGFSPEAALSASKYVNFENPHKADLVISFFRHHGFSQTQISTIIREHPGVLVSDPHKNLLPKLEFFHSKGFTTSDIATVLSRNSRILKRSLENHIIPSFVFLKNFLGTDGNTITAVKRFPGILMVKLDTHVVPNINLLRENGVPESNIGASIKKFPRIITTGAIQFKAIVEEVKEMGFNPLRLSFISAIFAIRGMKKSTRERKVNAYKRWGLSEEEILVAFGRSPQCIMASEDKIMRVMDLLVNKMGLEASLIVKRPNLLTLSLEKRLIPRSSVIQVLQSKGLIKKLFYLPAVFEDPEELFLQKFVMPYEKEASELLQLYKERLVFPE
ncbi:hypothetical protein CMV_021344 [Castanea mollissima]|uniref:Uncharacterized protein n=1 Tax=Castanea mollissima TaxID=60419 RepID=A0A8J4VCQ8_9ROSI|nr:hypothetical protein CMV_021344 [Castanea mollissima]